MSVTIEHDKDGRPASIKLTSKTEQLAGQAVIAAALVSRIQKARTIDGYVFITALDLPVLDAALNGYLTAIASASKRVYRGEDGLPDDASEAL